MDKQNTDRKQRVFLARFLTGMSFFPAIVAFPFSFLEAIGAMALPFALFGILFFSMAYYHRSKMGMKKHWAIIALVLNLIVGSLGLSNYLRNKKALDFVFGFGSIQSKVWGLAMEDEKKKKKAALLESVTNQAKDELRVEAGIESKASIEEVRPPIKETKEGPISEKDIREATGIYYYSTADKLRVRSSPDLEGEVLYHVEYGELLEYRGEKTQVFDKIMMGGKERHDYWYRVKSTKPFRKTGWVFGAAIKSTFKVEFEDEKSRNLVRTFNFINNDSLRTIIGDKDQTSGMIYSGLVSFKQDNNGTVVKQGRFYMLGLSKSNRGEIDGLRDVQEFRGTFKNGILHGAFEEESSYFESKHISQYEYENGTCLSYRIEIGSEGETEIDKSNKPEDCAQYHMPNRLQ